MLKRILLILMTALMMLPAVTMADENKNLLVNPGFEELNEGGLPTGWYTDAYLLRVGVSQFSTTEEARNGQHAVMIENFDMNDARFAQTVRVEPNSYYRLSGWIRADGILDAGHGANLSIEGVYVFSESLYETNGEWVFIELYGRTDQDQNSVTVFARVGGYSGESQGSACFDDLVLEQIEEFPDSIYPEAWYASKTVSSADKTSTSSTTPAPFWPWLIILGLAYCAIAVGMLRHLQMDESLSNKPVRANSANPLTKIPPSFIAGTVLVALIRIIVALNVEGYQVDVNCFTSWGNTMSSVGPTMFYQSTWCDYTPGYIYILGLNGWIAKLVSGYVSAAFIHKLLPIACDLAAAWLIYRIATENGYSRHQGSLFALLFAMNPATILNSAAWCQIDSVLCLLLMLVAYFAMHHKWSVVLPLYVLSILIKPQALMLGFLGLAALIIEFLRHPITVNGRKVMQPCHKEMIIGLAISLSLALVIVLPFCPHQESPSWLIEQYINTMSSYPYATVNTTNLFYLFGGNWDGIANQASTGACLFFMLLAAAWTGYTAFRQHQRFKLWYLEPCLMAFYTLIYLILAITGCSWTVLGVVTMSMAFAIVLPIYIRAGKLEYLPLCGAVIFLLLYIFGIKMHERYLFPAIFLFAMAYAIRRDRRIFALLIGTTCVLFINEGIVLDNSIRLGSEMGHLNPDTKMLANLLSILNVCFATVSIWVCHHICIEQCKIRLIPVQKKPRLNIHRYETHPCNPLSFKSNAKAALNKRDAVLVLITTIVYSSVTLTTLGSTKAPQTAWKSSAHNENVYIDLGKHYDEFSMLYFCQVSYSNFAVSVSDDLESESWSDPYPAQMAEGQCFQWKYLKPSYLSGGKPTFVDASTFADVQKLSGRYVCIQPQQVGLIINELIFKDASGNIIPDVSVIDRVNGNINSPNYSDPANLLDEQDSLDGEPSWWNSTYFDEIYHARTAFEHMNHANAYEWTHPPLGKIIMSWFVALFGMTPFGWRFGGALCGIIMLPVMYLLVKQLTKRSDMAFIAMMLMTLDCMHFTQTRIATIDSYPVLFIMLSYYFMLRFMQRDIVLDSIKSILPDLALCGFFMGCSVASKWIGVYAGIGLAVLYFWTCFRHLRMSRIASVMQNDGKAYTRDERIILERREKESFKRIVILCAWCLLFFVAVPIVIYLLSYVVHFSNREFTSLGAFLKTVYNTNFGKTNSMLSYHGTPGLGMDHTFYSPWYEWPLMMTPMYYASAAFKPEGMTYAIFCFGNPWVWIIGLAGIAYTVYRWAQGHCYHLEGHNGAIHLYRNDWDINSAFILIGLLAQFLPWVLVPRGTYIYHYFASIPFLILGTILLLHQLTQKHPSAAKYICITYLLLCFVWFVLLFPYASGLPTPEWWMDLIRDYPYINLMPNYWQSDFLVSLNNFLEKIPIFPHVYHH